MALVALLSALKSACKTGGTDCYCLLPNDHTAEGYVQQVWCFRAHACESSFGLSANEFAARYGEDTAACMMGPEVPFASTVLNAGIGPSGALPPDGADYWYLLLNCVTGLARASCDGVASDALLRAGQYCGPDVLKGLTCPPPIPDNCCVEDWQAPACRP